MSGEDACLLISEPTWLCQPWAALEENRDLLMLGERSWGRSCPWVPSLPSQSAGQGRSLLPAPGMHQLPVQLSASRSVEEKMLIGYNRLHHYLHSQAKAGLGSAVQMAAVAKRFPEREEMGVNSRLCN